MTLGDLELEILSILRHRGEMTPTELVAALRERREIAYTSVTTTLYRLREKGLVVAHEGPNSRVLYSADPSSREGRSALIDIVGRLVDAFGEATVSHAVGSTGENDEQALRSLSAAVAAKRLSRPARRARGERK